jgi:MFS family permease
LLTESLGWKSIFGVLIPIAALAAFLTYRKIKTEWIEARDEKLDIAGAAMLGISLVLMIMGFSKLPGYGGIIMIGSSLLLSILFILYERKVSQPLLNINLLLSNKVFSFSNLAALIHYSATSAIGFFLSLYLQYLKGFDARTAGLLLMTQPVMMALFSVSAGKLSDRINPGYLASTGIAMTSVGIFALTFINEQTSLAYIICILAFNGTGYALFSTPNSNAIMSSVEKKYLGVASGMLGTMRMIGQTMSLGVAMLLIALNIGQQKIEPENYPELLGTIKTGLVIFAVICIPAIFASLARNKGLNKNNHDNQRGTGEG